MRIDFKIRQFIQSNDYITIDQLIKEALSINRNSYYKTKKDIGSDGDFITSPEISQLFGEVIGIWCIDQWQKLGSPNQCNIVELGPGNGVLMRDALKSIKLKPDFYNNVSVQLFDINPHFKAVQKRNLSQFDLDITWIDDISQMKNTPTILIANEFFDALPIKQYIKVKEKWYEVIVKIEPFDSKIRFDKIELTSKQLQAQLLHEHVNAQDGAVIEESIESMNIIRLISDQIKKYTGSALIIDYGYDIKPLQRTKLQYNGTLQAMQDHQYIPILDSLGIADLSAHVDFGALKKIASAHFVNVVGVIEQSKFLIDHGILLRLNSMDLDLQTKYLLQKQVDRLINPNEMGKLFKVLIFSSYFS
ncbi:MAG: class I SAM-dependent methyltransferase [Rickettsiaceae bacterium]